MVSVSHTNKWHNLVGPKQPTEGLLKFWKVKNATSPYTIAWVFVSTLNGMSMSKNWTTVEVLNNHEKKILSTSPGKSFRENNAVLTGPTNTINEANVWSCPLCKYPTVCTVCNVGAGPPICT